MKKTDFTGYLSTLLIFIGAPLVALFVDSVTGWIFYSAAAILGMIYTYKKKDKAIFLQFAYYMIWNVMAIISRL